MKKIGLIVILAGGLIIIFLGFLFAPFLLPITQSTAPSCFLGFHFQYVNSEIESSEIIREITREISLINNPTLNFQFFDQVKITPHRGWGGFLLSFPAMIDSNSTEIFTIKSILEQVDGVSEVSEPIGGCESP